MLPVPICLFQVFFAVLIGAFALGQAGPNMEALFTAAGAAGTIFETIDRVSDCTTNLVSMHVDSNLALVLALHLVLFTNLRLGIIINPNKVIK